MRLCSWSLASRRSVLRRTVFGIGLGSFAPLALASSFVSSTPPLRVRFWSGRSEVQISGRSNRTHCCQRLATAATYLRKEPCCSGTITRRWAPQICHGRSQWKAGGQLTPPKFCFAPQIISVKRHLPSKRMIKIWINQSIFQKILCILCLNLLFCSPNFLLLSQMIWCKMSKVRQSRVKRSPNPAKTLFTVV